MFGLVIGFFILFIITFIISLLVITNKYWKDKGYNSNKIPVKITEDWIREQRNKMNRKYKNGLTLRQYILNRDNYTCKRCGVSKYSEPHLLLEVDHIIPVSKGGASVENNLQTLCWQCNRSKSNK